MEQGSAHLVDAEQVLAYVQDLGCILEVGSAGERQQFLRSFVRSIVWTDPEVTIEYTLPVPPSTVEIGQPDVVHIVTGGEGNRI